MHLDRHALRIGARSHQSTSTERQIEAAGETTALQKPFAAESHMATVGSRGMSAQHRTHTTRPMQRAFAHRL